MKQHPELKEWAQYSRGLVGSDRRFEMRRHLDEGCGRCAAALNVQRSVVALADADCRMAPPDRAVREIKSLFALNRPQRRSWLAPLNLDLVFDSALEPAMAGVRGRASCRQMVLESDDFGLDLQLTPTDAHSAVTGLLARRGGEAMGRVPAYLDVNDEIAGHTLSDEDGVFELDAELSEPAELWLQVAKEERIVIQLDPIH